MKPGLPLINTGFLLAAKPYKELFVEDRVPEHGLCRSLGLEVGAKDFHSTTQKEPPSRNGGSRNFGLLHQDPPAKELGPNEPHDMQPLSQDAPMKSLISIRRIEVGKPC